MSALGGAWSWGVSALGGYLLPRGAWSGGAWSGGCLLWGYLLQGCLVETPRLLLLQAVCILLECILVTCFCDSVHRGVCPIACWDTPPHSPKTRGRHLPLRPEADTPLWSSACWEIWATSGQHASYLNAILLTSPLTLDHSNC